MPLEELALFWYFRDFFHLMTILVLRNITEAVALKILLPRYIQSFVSYWKFFPRFSNFCRAAFRNSHQRCSVKNVFLDFSQYSQENTCVRVSFLIKLEALAQVYSCEFCEISVSTFFTEHVWVTASKLWRRKPLFDFCFLFTLICAVLKIYEGVEGGCAKGKLLRRYSQMYHYHGWIAWIKPLR